MRGASAVRRGGQGQGGGGGANALEVGGATAAGGGGGPADLVEVTMALGAEMLVLGGVAATREGARQMMRDAISSGRALGKLEEIVTAQGGDARVVRDPARLPRAPRETFFQARRAGVVQSVDPRAIGHGVIALGGGRTNMEDTIDPSVGFVVSAKPGTRVEKG